MLLCFFGNIKFNGAVSLNIISQQTLKQYPSSSTRQMFLLYNFQILYLNTKRKFKKSYKINEIFTSYIETKNYLFGEKIYIFQQNRLKTLQIMKNCTRHSARRSLPHNLANQRKWLDLAFGFVDKRSGYEISKKYWSFRSPTKFLPRK